MKNWLLVGQIIMSASIGLTQEPPGAPGALGVWQRPDKQAYGTTAHRPVWFTVAEGVVGEITFPQVDLVQTRDTFIVVREGNKFLDERNLKSRIQRHDGTLAFFAESDVENMKVKKEIVAVSDSDALVIDYSLSFATPADREIILVHNPIAAGTAGGDVMEVTRSGMKTPSLLAYQGDIRGDEPQAYHVQTRQLVSWSLTDTIATTGFEGTSSPEDQMKKGEWPKLFEKAGPGNVAGALFTSFAGQQIRFRVVIQFFENTQPTHQLVTLMQTPLKDFLNRQRQEWQKYLSRLSYDKSDVRAESSILVVKALEDKVEKGAFIAGPGNPNLPWSTYANELDYENSRRRIGDSNFGYRRVWPRDLYHKAMGLLAIGDNAGAIQVARWFKKTQFADGWWSQNMFVDGYPSWGGYQQDEAALPVVLVAHLVERGLVDYVEFRPMVRKALQYITKRGPGTDQERWEENGGLSPNSLGAAVQAFGAGAWLEKSFGESELGLRYREVASDWTKNFKNWTLIANGLFGANYIARLELGSNGKWDPNVQSDFRIGNKRGDQKTIFREDEILDLGFIQWIITGIVPGNDADFARTIDLCDRHITGNSEFGRGYFRYSEDSYGENHRGGQWPLLSGERLLVALERGENYHSHLSFIENMFTESGMLGEQDTLAIRPLGWSHANYLIVRRSIADGKSFYRLAAQELGQLQ